MSHQKWKIIYYEKTSGRCPVQEFIDKQNANEKVYINLGMDNLEEHGNKLDRPHVEHLGEKIYALRIKILRKQYRIFYFFFRENKIILTHGYIKKTRRVSKSELTMAINYRNDYLSRNS